MDQRKIKENLPPQKSRKPRGRHEGGPHSLEGASPAPHASTSNKGRSAALRASEAVENAIAHEKENRTRMIKTMFERDATKETVIFQGQDMEEEPFALEHDTADNDQLCDLEVEELAKRAKAALNNIIADRDGGNKSVVTDIERVVTELTRRTASPDPNIANMRAVNSHLRMKLDIMQKEIRKLRREFKTNCVETERGQSSMFSDEDVGSPLRKQNRVADSLISDVEMGDSLGTGKEVTDEERHALLSQVDPVILDIVTRKVTAAVDRTLSMFLERIRPLEDTVTRLTMMCSLTQNEPFYDPKDAAAREMNLPRGKKRRAEEPLPAYGEQPMLAGHRFARPPLIHKFGARKGIFRDEASLVGSQESLSRIERALSRRKRAVVILQVQDAEEISLSTVMRTLREAFDAEKDLGIRNFQIHKINKEGSRVFSIMDDDADHKAKLFMAKVKEVIEQFGTQAKVSRPKPNFLHFSVVGFDDSITREDILGELKKVMDCTEDKLKLGQLINYEDKWRIGLRCEDNVARRLLDLNRVRIGWTYATILYRKKAIRCFRCLRTGHTIRSCTDSVDRGGSCFKCGSKEHDIAKCQSDPHCLICSDSGVDANHRVSDGKCIFPTFIVGRRNSTRTYRSRENVQVEAGEGYRGSSQLLGGQPGMSLNVR